MSYSGLANNETAAVLGGTLSYGEQPGQHAHGLPLAGDIDKNRPMIKTGQVLGAGEGNRTLVCSLGSCRSTIELRPPGNPFKSGTSCTFGPIFRLAHVATRVAPFRALGSPLITRSSTAFKPFTACLAARNVGLPRKTGRRRRSIETNPKRTFNPTTWQVDQIRFRLAGGYEPAGVVMQTIRNLVRRNAGIAIIASTLVLLGTDAARTQSIPVHPNFSVIVPPTSLGVEPDLALLGRIGNGAGHSRL